MEYIIKQNGLPTFWSEYLNRNENERCSLLPYDGMIIPADEIRVSVDDVWKFECESRLETGERVELFFEFNIIENDSITNKFKLIKKEIKFKCTY